MANQKYTSIKNDYSIVFDKNSTIELATDDASIMAQGFCFITIDEVNQLEQMRTIDAIGLITQVGQLTQINIKQTGTVKDRRNVVIADESGLCITVSLWGQNARMDKYTEGQVMSIRGARVSDYNGKSLNSGDEHSQMFIDIDHKRRIELKKWWAIKRTEPLTFNSITGGMVNSLMNPAVNSGSYKNDSAVPTSERDNFKLCEELVKEVEI